MTSWQREHTTPDCRDMDTWSADPTSSCAERKPVRGASDKRARARAQGNGPHRCWTSRAGARWPPPASRWGCPRCQALVPPETPPLSHTDGTAGRTRALGPLAPELATSARRDCCGVASLVREPEPEPVRSPALDAGLPRGLFTGTACRCSVERAAERVCNAAPWQSSRSALQRLQLPRPAPQRRCVAEGQGKSLPAVSAEAGLQQTWLRAVCFPARPTCETRPLARLVWARHAQSVSVAYEGRAAPHRPPLRTRRSCAAGAES